ncbi:hypothetical protein MKX75_23950 [Paenibacillus sp. FSL R5-0341]|uniref:hypothetical protein n=1 Tax=Paenibacillus sp. FSL R5-0341 TaxID=2921636 RepID=UPI0030CB24BC
MSNAIWRLNADNLAAYTEDREVIRKIGRSFPDFTIMATYEREGRLVAIQYRVPSARKRSIRRLLGVNVSG